MEKSKALEMIAAISNANGISGFEEEVVAAILPYAKTVGETNVDRMRNVFIRRNGNTYYRDHTLTLEAKEQYPREYGYDSTEFLCVG